MNVALMTLSQGGQRRGGNQVGEAGEILKCKGGNAVIVGKAKENLPFHRRIQRGTQDGAQTIRLAR